MTISVVLDLECPYCSRQFSMAEEFEHRRHIEHANRGGHPIQCPGCQSVFIATNIIDPRTITQDISRAVPHHATAEPRKSEAGAPEPSSASLPSSSEVPS